MKEYIGTKTVNAKPMNLGDYNKLRGWDIPSDQDPRSEGYLVEYLDGGKANHPNFKNYISWSPKDVFERTYSLTAEIIVEKDKENSMKFGKAIEAMESGEKVARKGWNGKNMWITVSGSDPVNLEADKFWNKHSRKAAEENGGTMEVLPYFIMKTADNKILMGWLASQTDMLADDWELVCKEDNIENVEEATEHFIVKTNNNDPLDKEIVKNHDPYANSINGTEITVTPRPLSKKED